MVQPKLHLVLLYQLCVVPNNSSNTKLGGERNGAIKIASIPWCEYLGSYGAIEIASVFAIKIASLPWFENLGIYGAIKIASVILYQVCVVPKNN